MFSLPKSYSTALNKPNPTNTYAVGFDGVNDFITGTFPESALDDKSFVGAWIKVDATAGIKTIIDGREADNDGIWFYVNADEKLCVSEDNVDVVGNTILDSETWYYVCYYIRNGENRVLYVNGVRDCATESTSDTTSQVAPYDFTVGATNYDAKAHFFKGEIGEIAVYQGNLFHALPHYTYNDGEPFDHLDHYLSQHLKLWWRFGDNYEDITDLNIMHDETGGRSDAYGTELYTTANAASITNEADATTGWAVTVETSTVNSVETASRFSHGSSSIQHLFVHVNGSDSFYTSWTAVSGKMYKISFTISYASIQEGYPSGLVESALQIASGEPDDSSAEDGGITGITFDAKIWTEKGGYLTSVAAAESGDVRITIFAPANATTMYFIWHWYGTVGNGQIVTLDGLSIREVIGSDGAMYNFPTNYFEKAPPGSPL